MKTNLSYLSKKVNLLTLTNINIINMDDVDAWLYAIDFSPSDRKEACRQILTDGNFSVSNIEHRITIVH